MMRSNLCKHWVPTLLYLTQIPAEMHLFWQYLNGLQLVHLSQSVDGLEKLCTRNADAMALMFEMHGIPSTGLSVKT